jgi:hypothetical protein
MKYLNYLIQELWFALVLVIVLGVSYNLSLYCGWREPHSVTPLMAAWYAFSFVVTRSLWKYWRSKKKEFNNECEDKEGIL